MTEDDIDNLTADLGCAMQLLINNLHDEEWALEAANDVTMAIGKIQMAVSDVLEEQEMA